jgi:hypothetical protein
MNAQDTEPRTTLTDVEKAQLDLRTKSIAAAIDWSKHLATLATGSVVVSGTFLKDLLGPKQCHKWLIILCWGCLIGSLLVNIFVFGAFVARLNDSRRIADIDAYSSPGRGLAFLQAVLFLSGLILFVIYVSLNLPS